jgi:hypothetical protein
MLFLYLFLMSLPLKLLVTSNSHAYPNPHQPQNVIWELRDSVTGQVIQRLKTSEQPTFSIDICDLFGKNWNLYRYTGKRGNRYGCGHYNLEEELQSTQYYVCPANTPGCQGSGQYYCASWSCVTEAPWIHNDPFISITDSRRDTPSKTCGRGTCNPLKITLKFWKPWSKSMWKTRKTWGF